ncbi:iron-containing alcohol dehydrogenase [Telmatospirillum sp.]|uniref:iron-containing alcohol dehydrogenase n=1 Tax=Telmatospirillum sp. TaxID=2079197 RepID=UPI00284EE768|nr:iron-containing alcohol dehydrogenase [Telmatospirillum sp.]MDR3436909.1 iron-containing alcohol dehydrogenase [Telmatospirillum sp.]
MQNFVFQNPTKILFGKGQIARLNDEIPTQARVLVTYGGGSVKRNGTLAEVRAALAGRTVFEFGGVEPNPTYETLMRAVDLARKESVDFLLAVGGGSVVDGTKFISAAVPFVGEPWDIVAKKGMIEQVVPFGVVLTLPATGSEMNPAAVITRKASRDKLGFINRMVYPRFSILDPVKTYTLPPRQVANGVIDAFVHVIEQYLTFPAGAAVQDRFAEGLLLTLIEEGPKALVSPQDYDVRANIMWCATLALNGLISAGVPQDWTTHMIGHELTVLYGLDHAQTLAIVLPATLTVLREAKRAKLLQYASRIWGIATTDEDAAINEAIARTRGFFESLGVPTRLAAYGVSAAGIPTVVEQLRRHGLLALGERQAVTLEVSERILALCA